MKTLRILVCLWVVVSLANSLSGQTLHPLYDDKTEKTFEPALLGTWAACAGNAFPMCMEFQFEKSSDGAYRGLVPLQDDPKVDVVGTCHLVRLGDTLFGDLKLTDILVAGKGLSARLEPSLFQTHFIVRLSFKQGKLVMSGIDFKRAETQRALAESGIQLQLDTLDDGSTIALAPTADLQKFVRMKANDDRIFSDTTEWERPEKEGEK